MRLFSRFAVAKNFHMALALLSGVVTHPVWAFEALPKLPPIPADNPQSPEKIALGKELFFDPRLSATGNVSCNSCHNVMAGGEDGLPTSFGVNGKRGGRSSPTVWNAAFMSVQFWDGRAPSLEEQAKGPMVNPVEMGNPNHDAVIARLRRIPGYVQSFKVVFGGKNPVTITNTVKAIAAYERTLITPNSAFDRFMAGDKQALNAQALRGMHLVETIGCTGCHSGPNFAGPELPAGTGFYQKFPTIEGTDFEKTYHLADDLGRYNVTKNAADKHMWRVPTWRNVALTAPYFHNGSVPTLPEAVRVMAKTQLNRDLKTNEVDDIVAFLDSLTGEFPTQTLPVLPPAPHFSVMSGDETGSLSGKRQL